MELTLVFKEDGLASQSHRWLLQLLQLKQCERVRYPAARAHLHSSILGLDCFL